jgi:glycerol-3-phosphate acyltransferase PlsY
MIYYTISFFIGFFFGMIPFSYLIARIKGIDLKTVGSGNIGATNLGRSLGLSFFLLGFILDGLKGLTPVLLARGLTLSAAVAGAGAICGHIFNPLFHWRGGKGVSTTIGVAIGLTPIAFVLSLIVWIVIYMSTYLVSFASVIFVIVLPLSAFIMHEGQTIDRLLLLVIALVVIFTHRTNMKRLLKKEEPKTIFWKK